MKTPVAFCKIALSGIAIAFSSCHYDKREMPEPVIPIDTTQIIICDTINPVTYTNFVKSILETYCTISGCHDIDAPPGLDYTTYAGIKAKVDNGKFYDRVINLQDMPEPDSLVLDSCTLLHLQEWLNNGAPE